MRARRQSHDSFDAAECWAKSPSIQMLSNDFEKRGFVLNPMVRMFTRKNGSHTVRLVWRHRELTCSIVLTVRT
jgi:hypothetical protein